MRIFVAFEDIRLQLDIQPGQTVGDVKTVLRDHFKLNSSHVEDKILQLTYAGAVLHDTWVCSDLGITSGATVKSALKDSDKPVLLIDCPFNGEIIVIRDQIDPAKTYIKDLRTKVSTKTGLPVSIFRLCTPDGREMFDCHTMEEYKISLCSTIQLHVWDGWGDLLTAATQGHTKKVYKNISSDEQISRFQLRVACYIAAHFGYVDLANSLINPKRGAVKPEEPIGQHPAKLWTRESSHIDTWKSPIHEAAERGNVNVLRIFVQHNICSLVTRDGRGHTPIQVCCRYGQTESLLYLTSKLYGSYTENNVTLPTVVVIKSRKWCERARERVLMKYGAYVSSIRRKPYKGSAVVGHGVIIDGYRESLMQSKSKVNELMYLSQWATDTAMSLPILQRPRKPTRHRRSRTVSSTMAFKDSGQDRGWRQSTTTNSAAVSGVPEKRFPNLPSTGRSRPLRFMSRDGEEVSPSEDDNTDSASYIQTPKPGHQNKDLPGISRATHSRPSRRTKLIDGALSLPAVSVENTLRPFFHVSSRIDNPVLLTLNTFEKYRGINARDSAIHCMIVASTFKDKAWLRQVDMAISLAKRGVHNCLKKSNPSESEVIKSLPTIATSAVKTRC